MGQVRMRPVVGAPMINTRANITMVDGLRVGDRVKYNSRNTKVIWRIWDIDPVLGLLRLQSERNPDVYRNAVHSDRVRRA